MIPALVVIAGLVGAAAVATVATREPELAAVGLAVVLVGATFLTDPLPSPAILGARVVGGLLAAALLRSAATVSPAQPSPLGWPGEALIAVAAAIAGVGIGVALASLAASAGPGAAPAPAFSAATVQMAAGGGLLAVSLAPALGGSGARPAIGMVLLVQAALLIRTALAGPPTELESIAAAMLLVAAAAAGATLLLARGSPVPETAPGEPGRPDLPGPTVPPGTTDRRRPAGASGKASR
jgi:hypothetical protein